MKPKTITEGDGDPRHGSHNGYINLSCRCQPCRDAWAAYHLQYMHAEPERMARARDRQAFAVHVARVQRTRGAA